MKKKVNLGKTALTILSCMIFSCTSYDIPENYVDDVPKNQSHRLTAEQAKQNALEFIAMYGRTTRGDDKNIEVLEVKAIGKEQDKTRSISNSVNLDSLFYIVNFDNNNGFVIAASDDREIPVFAYVEEGNYNDSIVNSGYDRFVNSLIEAEIENRNNQEEIRDFADSPLIPIESGENKDEFEIMYPLLCTKWNQTLYSSYCPGQYTGCVPTAISQICSFLEYPTRVSWYHNGIENTSDIDWDEINNECRIYNGNPQSSYLRDQIANLMRFWGVCFDAEYDSEGTGVDSGYAINKMKDFGFNVTSLSDYDAVNVKNELAKGDRVIYMRGNARYYHVGFVFRKYVDGHGWVVDGYIRSVKSGIKSLYLHCNWGWGGAHNGYFLSSVLNAEAGPDYDDSGTPVTRSTDFKYKLKTSTICR